MLTWPEAVLDVYPAGTTAAYADHLLRRAGRLAAAFPGVELWDHLDAALRHAMRWYDAKRGPFDKLFETVLRERLHKAARRAAGKAGRRRRAEEEYARSRHGTSDAGEPTEAFDRWAAVLLDRAGEYLDHQTHTYIRMRRRGEPVAAIAAVLGETEQALKNRYGGQKLAGKVRAAVRRLVLELPERHRQLLVRHLAEEAGLGSGRVGTLLGVAVAVDESVPALAEDEVLTVVGWAEKNPAAGSATTAGEREYVF